VVDTASEPVVLANTFALRLLLVLVMAGDVADDVCRPANKLLSNEVKKRGNWCILSELVELVSELTKTRRVDLSGRRVEDHVAVKVAGGLVVLAVRDLPREVWDEKCRVENPSNGVVDGLGGRE